MRATNATREKDGWSVYATIEWQMVCNGLGVHCNTFHCEQVVSIFGYGNKAMARRIEEKMCGDGCTRRL